MVQQVTLQQIAKELADAFETRKRDNGSEFVTLKDAARGTWIQDAVREAHGESLPNDSTYAMCGKLADAMNDFMSEIAEENLDANEPMAFDEFIDPLVPVYNSELKQWFSDNPDADSFVEQALSDGLVDPTASDFNIYRLLSVGHFLQLEEIGATLWNAVTKRYNALSAETE